jgi:hypothetical protein
LSESQSCALFFALHDVSDCFDGVDPLVAGHAATRERPSVDRDDHAMIMDWKSGEILKDDLKLLSSGRG